jgi:hypothetical protein
MFLRNLLALVYASILSISLSLLLNKYSAFVSVNWLYGLLFLIAFCFALNLVYAYNAGSKTYTELLITSIVIKLLVALIVIVVYSFINASDFFNFSIHFILHYVLFTIFEIRYLLFIIKSNSSIKI